MKISGWERQRETEWWKERDPKHEWSQVQINIVPFEMCELCWVENILNSQINEIRTQDSWCVLITSGHAPEKA